LLSPPSFRILSTVIPGPSGPKVRPQPGIHNPKRAFVSLAEHIANAVVMDSRLARFARAPE